MRTRRKNVKTMLRRRKNIVILLDQATQLDHRDAATRIAMRLLLRSLTDDDLLLEWYGIHSSFQVLIMALNRPIH